MIRQLLQFVAIAFVCFLSLSAMAQTDNRRPWIWGVFALAEFPLVHKRHDVQYPVELVSEYRRLTEWLQESEHASTGPEYFDLVAVPLVPDELPKQLIELELTRDRKVGEFHEPGTGSLELAREQAIWEGPVHIETTTIGRLDGKTGTYVWFGPYSADELWHDLVARGLWPWEVRYEVTLRCNGCPAPAYSRSTSFTMTHAPQPTE